MLHRLETMVLMGMELPLSAIRGQIASGVDILVHVGRMRDGSRKLLNIMEVGAYTDGRIELYPLWEFQEKGEKGGRVIGEWKSRERLKNTRKLEWAGIENPHRSRHYGSDSKIVLQKCSGTITVFSCVLLLSEILCKKRAGGKKTPITAGI